MLDRGRIAIPTDDFFRAGSGAAARDVRARRRASSSRSTRRRCAPRRAMRVLIDRKVRSDPRANALFLDVLTSPTRSRDGAALDERGRRVRPLRSRFRPRRRADAVRHVPSLYGRRAFDPRDRPARRDRARRAASRIIRSSTAIFKQIASRRVLYVAVLLHDIAKGRGGDHSVLGAEIALKLCPRFGLDAAETETVAWLVRHHLLMSATAFKRDLADPKTIEDFVASGAEPGAAAAAADPDRRRHPRGRAGRSGTTGSESCCGPCSKRPRSGSASATSSMAAPSWSQRAAGGAGGASSAGRRAPLRAHAQAPARQLLARRAARRGRSPMRGRSPSAEARIGDAAPNVVVEADADSGATRVSVFTPDREGLFYRICAGLASAGANIIDARIHTTRDGMALDNLLVLDGQGRAYADRRLRGRLVQLGRSGARRSPSRRRCRLAEPQRRSSGVRASRRRSSIAEQASTPDHGRRGQCAATGRRCSPALARRDPRLRATDPFRAYRDLWRARGRRLLSDQRRRPEARPWRDRATALGAAERRGLRRRRGGLQGESPRAAAGLAEDCRLAALAAGGGGGGGGGGGAGQASVARMTVPSAQVWSPARAAAAEPAARHRARRDPRERGLAAQRHAEGPRLTEERAVELGRGRDRSRPERRASCPLPWTGASKPT